MSVRKVGDSKKVKKLVTCRHCGSILEYLPADVKERTVRDYSGDSDNYRWIVCPSCQEEVEVRP